MADHQPGGALEELHDAPVLFISVETPPEFTAEEKKKLRAFTDTGGTILLEASCGNPDVRTWFSALAKEIWPEWAVRPLGPDHPSFLYPNRLEERPEVMGIDDGLRTAVFYAMDDVSCPWQTRAFASKEYMFLWGINLFTYATDKGPLRAKLDTAAPTKFEKYASAVKAGPRADLHLARLKTDGDWTVGRQYKGLEGIAAEASKRAGLTLKVDDTGLGPVALGDQDLVYLVGAKEAGLAEKADRNALKNYLAKGGFLWAEAARGSLAFDRSFRALAELMGWDLKPLPRTDAVMTGAFATGRRVRHQPGRPVPADDEDSPRGPALCRPGGHLAERPTRRHLQPV